MFPTVKPLLMSSSSRPLWASACSDSHRGRTHASADKVSDVVNMGKFMKKY